MGIYTQHKDKMVICITCARNYTEEARTIVGEDNEYLQRFHEPMNNDMSNTEFVRLVEQKEAIPIINEDVEDCFMCVSRKYIDKIFYRMIVETKINGITHDRLKDEIFRHWSKYVPYKKDRHDGIATITTKYKSAYDHIANKLVEDGLIKL